MAPIGTSAVLLRAHAYGETSRVLRFYTRSHGLLAVMARGVRTRSGKGTATLDTFASGELSAYVRGNRDLHTMKDFACTHPRTGLGSDMLRFIGASAVAELLLGHTDQEPHPEVYDALEAVLDRLEASPAEEGAAAGLSGVWKVVATLGFSPELDGCVQCGTPIGDDEVGRFHLAAGGMLCPGCAEGSTAPRVGPVARGQIRAMVKGDPGEAVTHPRRHLALLSDFVSFHVATRPLKSLRMLGDLLPPEAPDA